MLDHMCMVAKDNTIFINVSLNNVGRFFFSNNQLLNMREVPSNILSSVLYFKISRWNNFLLIIAVGFMSLYKYICSHEKTPS